MKLKLYFDSVRYMKPSQVFWRIAKRMGIPCTLGHCPNPKGKTINVLPQLPLLDFDPVFLNRFSVEKLMTNHVVLLHEEEILSWNGSWDYPNQSLLWNFNLHYFEYLFPLVSHFLEYNESIILDKCMEMISGWITSNPISRKGNGWAPYTVSLRIVNWISFYGYVHDWLPQDFHNKLLHSIEEQYVFLSRHLEKDVLGNHYFENLKALLLCSLFLNDRETTDCVLPLFVKECREEILDDGMHFELSPMYHNIVLEGMIRTDTVLRQFGLFDQEIHTYTCRMLDAAFSLCNGLERIPHFNDGGNNAAKSIASLLEAGERYCGYTATLRKQFPDAGFYQFIWGKYKMIVDAGKPGPEYVPGHSHCDAMSFELYRNGKPLLANCGTYAYQSKERVFFRSTVAHNTVVADGVEQSQCWGVFRLAKRSSVYVRYVSDCEISMEMCDQRQTKIVRTISISDKAIQIVDQCKGKHLQAFYHLVDSTIQINTPQSTARGVHLYSEEYGKIDQIPVVIAAGTDMISVTIPLEG